MAVYGPWIQSYEWKWWVTLTSSRNLGREENYPLVEEYLCKLEVTHRDCLSCVIAQEQKTFSGCGKPSGRVHFHLLVACVVNLTVRSFSDLWERKEFGGTRVTGPIGFHSFRHGLGTMLRQMGVDLKIAQELLRHANSRITLEIYQQTVGAEKRTAQNLAFRGLLGEGCDSAPFSILESNDHYHKPRHF